MREQLLSHSENNSVYNILLEIKLLLRIRNNNSFLDDVGSRELLSYSENDLDQVGKILSIRDLRRMAWHFLDYGAATATILQNRLELSQPTSYRYLKNLKVLNFISLAIKARLTRGKKGGPRPDIWMVPDATTEQINAAQRLHWNIMSPKYLYAEKMAQLIIDEYIIVNDITDIYKVKYITFLRDKKVKPSIIPDIVMLSIPYFKEKGYTFIS